MPPQSPPAPPLTAPFLPQAVPVELPAARRGPEDRPDDGDVCHPILSLQPRRVPVHRCPCGRAHGAAGPLRNCGHMAAPPSQFPPKHADPGSPDFLAECQLWARTSAGHLSGTCQALVRAASGPSPWERRQDIMHRPPGRGQRWQSAYPGRLPRGSGV